MGAFDGLPKALRKLRGAKPQREVAALADVSAQQVHRYETGGAMPELRNLEKILDGFGLTLYDLARALDEVNGRTPPASADFEQRAARPLNLSSLDVVTAKIRDLRDALNDLALDPPLPSLVPSTKRDPDPLVVP